MYYGAYGFNNGYAGNRFGGLAFILVLFILLAIICPTFENRCC